MLLSLLLCVSITRAQTSSLTDVFETANVAASRGDHAGAVAGYATLLESGVRDPDVFFNLATTFARAGDYGRAILNYERALVLRPNDDETIGNLRRAEQLLEEQRAEVEGEATIHRRTSIAEAIYDSFTEDVLAVVLLTANAGFFACLGWAWMSRRRSGWLIALSTTLGLLLAFSAFGLAVKSGSLRDGPRAVALGDRVPLREGPDAKARIRGEARGGDRGDVVAADGDFVKLRVINGAEGWADATEVGVVDLDERVH
jgi:tetratricopeptide (TPR) repeat protein